MGSILAVAILLVSLLLGLKETDHFSQAAREAQLGAMMSFEIEDIQSVETTVKWCEITIVTTSLRRCVVFGQMGRVITKIDLLEVNEIVDRTVHGDLVITFRPAELPMDQSLIEDFAGTEQTWYCDGSFVHELKTPLPSFILPETEHPGLPATLIEYDRTYCN